MKFKVMVLLALRNLKRNKKKTFLTMLGIIIGIAAVITIVALGQGYKKSMIEQITGEGSGEVEIIAQLMADSNELDSTGQDIFSVYDKKSMEDINGVKSVDFYRESDVYGQFMSIDVRGKKFEGKVENINKDNVKIDSKNLIGRNITAADNDRERRVIVLSEDLIGKGITDLEGLIGGIASIKGITFEIVGIEKSLNANEISFSMPTSIQIPENVFNKYFNLSQRTVALKILLTKDASVEGVTKDVKDILNENGTNRNMGEYMIQDSNGAIKMMGSVLDTLTLFISAVAGISLFIAGIGVMNMVYTSVSERTIEIGIKRAIGAKRRDIRMEFLIEGITIALCGGIIGYFMGIIFANLFAIFLDLTIVPDLFTASIAIGVSGLVGILSSILPANKAAMSNTVDILK